MLPSRLIRKCWKWDVLPAGFLGTSSRPGEYWGDMSRTSRQHLQPKRGSTAVLTGTYEDRLESQKARSKYFDAALALQ